MKKTIFEKVISLYVVRPYLVVSRFRIPPPYIQIRSQPASLPLSVPSVLENETLSCDEYVMIAVI